MPANAKLALNPAESRSSQKVCESETMVNYGKCIKNKQE